MCCNTFGINEHVYTSILRHGTDRASIARASGLGIHEQNSSTLRSASEAKKGLSFVCPIPESCRVTELFRVHTVGRIFTLLKSSAIIFRLSMICAAFTVILFLIARVAIDSMSEGTNGGGGRGLGSGMGIRYLLVDSGIGQPLCCRTELLHCDLLSGVEISEVSNELLSVPDGLCVIFVLLWTKYPDKCEFLGDLRTRAWRHL